MDFLPDFLAFGAVRRSRTGLILKALEWALANGKECNLFLANKKNVNGVHSVSVTWCERKCTSPKLIDREGPERKPYSDTSQSRSRTVVPRVSISNPEL